MKAVAVGLGLVGVSIVVARMHQLRIESEIVIAAIRALVQLGIVALVIGTVFGHLGLAGIFVIIMLAAASWTAGRRLAGVPARFVIGGASVTMGAGPVFIALFALGAYPLSPRFVIPIAGILIGGSMTAAAVAGHRLKQEMDDKAQEIEARLSLGVPARFALRSYVPSSVVTALIPVLDQTKNVGLITLPGAFVGMILGGASALEAAQVQLNVLFSLLAAQIAAATVAAFLVGRSFIGPGERILTPVGPGES